MSDNIEYVWFLSSAGDRHEDHVPVGIFSSLEKLEEAIKNNTAGEIVVENDGDVINYISYLDGHDMVAFVYNAYRVKLDEFDPQILNT